MKKNQPARVSNDSASQEVRKVVVISEMSGHSHLESLPDDKLSDFFRANGLPNLASSLDKLKHLPAK